MTAQQKDYWLRVITTTIIVVTCSVTVLWHSFETRAMADQALNRVVSYEDRAEKQVQGIVGQQRRDFTALQDKIEAIGGQQQLIAVDVAVIRTKVERFEKQLNGKTPGG